MKTEEPIDPKVQELLKRISDHRENQLRQQQLSDLIDNLERAESARPRRRWIGISISAVAACLLAVGVIRFATPTADEPALPMRSATTAQVAQDTCVASSAQEEMPQPKVRLHNYQNNLAIAQSVQHEDATLLIVEETGTATAAESPTITETEIDSIQISQSPIRRKVTSNQLICYTNQKDKDTPSVRKVQSNTQPDPHLEEGVMAIESH